MKIYHRWRQISSEGEVVNLITISKDLGWEPLFHTVGSTWHGSNGLSGHQYGWKKWEQWCVAFDMDVGQTITYVNGVDDGAQVNFFTIHIIRSYLL